MGQHFPLVFLMWSEHESTEEDMVDSIPWFKQRGEPVSDRCNEGDEEDGGWNFGPGTKRRPKPYPHTLTPPYPSYPLYPHTLRVLQQ